MNKVDKIFVKSCYNYGIGNQYEADRFQELISKTIDKALKQDITSFKVASYIERQKLGQALLLYKAGIKSKAKYMITNGDNIGKVKTVNLPYYAYSPDFNREKAQEVISSSIKDYVSPSAIALFKVDLIK